MGLRTQLGLWTLLELLQISGIVFIMAMFATFVIGSIFTQIDKALEKTTLDGESCDNNSDYIVGLFFVTFFELVVIAATYYLITKILKSIPSVSATLKPGFPGHRTTEFTLHIVLIVLLIELNPSIVHNLHRLAYYFDISKYEYKCK